MLPRFYDIYQERAGWSARRKKAWAAGREGVGGVDTRWTGMEASVSRIKKGE